MASVDPLLDREHSKEYQCAHFVREAYTHLYGRDLAPSFEGFILPPKDRTAIKEVRHDFETVKYPIDGSIAVFRKIKGHPHVGLCHKGSVLNLVKSGVQYVPLHVVMLNFKSVKFYKPIHRA